MRGSNRHRKRHVGRWLSLGLVAVLVSGWFVAPPVVERIILARLSNHAIDGVSLAVRRVGPFETLIEQVRVPGSPAVSADRIILRYTPVAIFRGDIYSITLEGLVVEGGAHEMALAAERVERVLRTASGLRIAHIEFGEAKLALAAPGGTWNANLRGALIQAPSGALDGAFTVVATGEAGAFGGQLRLDPDGDGRTTARLRLREAVVRLPGLTLEPLTGEIAVGRSDAPLPRLEIDLEMGGRAADGRGLERARLRLVSDGAAASASLAGIDDQGRRLTIEGAADATAEADGVALRLSRPGSFSFLGRPLHGAAPSTLEVRIEPGDLPLARLVTDVNGTWIIHALRLALRPAVIATGAGPLHLSGGLVSADGRLGPERARGGATVRLPQVTMPRAGIRAEDAVIAVHWEEGPPRFELTATRIASTAEPAWFPPLPLAIAGTGTPAGIAFRGNLGGSLALATVEIEGAAGRNGTGHSRLRLRPIDLGREPGALSPALVGIAAETRGRLAARGEIAWNRDGVRGTAQALFEDVAATLPFGRVDRVNGVVALDRLVPPSTAGLQTLSVGAVDVGLPLTDGILSFRIDDGQPVLATGRFDVAGGQVTLAESALSPAFDRARLKLEAVDLDPALLAEGAGIGGLAPTGSIGGGFSVAIDGDGAKVEGGRLAGAGLDLHFSGERRHGLPATARVGAGDGVAYPLADLDGWLDRFRRHSLDRHRISEATRRQMEAYGAP